MRQLRPLASLLLLCLLVAVQSEAASVNKGLASALASSPLAFERNQGQSDGAVKFLARGNGYGIFVARGEIVFVLHDRVTAAEKPKGQSVVRLQFPGANLDAVAEGIDLLPGVSNYIKGNDPAAWKSNVPHYAKVRLHDIYPGIDLVCYGNQKQLEYDVVVRPGADITPLRLHAVGAKPAIDRKTGDLLLDTSRGVVRQKLPLVFEEAGGTRSPVDSRYRVDRNGDIRFEIGEHRPDQTLVIDPVVIYSTYHGGSDQDAGFGIAADASGSAYVAGYTASVNFPTTAGAFQTANASNNTTDFFDVFVSKFSDPGTGLVPPTLVYSTYVGGSKDDFGIALALDPTNNVYVTGHTNSLNFPTTAGAFRTTPPVGTFTDAFVFKLNAAGGMVYSTYVGGNNDDGGEGIAVDAAGNAYVDGITSSLATFPGGLIGPGGAIDGFVFKLNPAGSALVYSTRVGGSANDATEAVNLDAAGNAYVAAHSGSIDFPMVAAIQPASNGREDTTLYKLDPTGTSLLYSTYLGGSGDDFALAVQTDAAGNAYFTGKTNSPFTTGTTQFPTSPGAFLTTNAGPAGSNDVFITKLTPAGTMAYSTLVGSVRDDIGYGIGVDAKGNATFAGETNVITGLETDIFIAKMNSTGTAQVYGLLFRGSVPTPGSPRADDSGRDLDFDAKGYAYVTGYTASTDLTQVGGPPGLKNPRQAANAGGTDAVVIKFTDSVDLQITKTDGQATAIPGGPITYTITVTNPGPFDATGATVVDTFPPELTGVTWTSTVTGGASTVPASGSGNMSNTVNVPIGGSITYTVSATIVPSATGTLANTATVTESATVVDVNNANNTATDTDVLTPTVDLSITKTDGKVSVIPGTGNQYTIVVTNAGPSTVVGATITDIFPATYTGVTYTATPTGGATGFTASGAGNIADTVTMPAGSTITYIVNGTVAPSATGSLSNTAIVSAPVGTTESNPGNNTATDTDAITPQADLQITKTDGVTSAVPGNSVTYTITATNAGPSDVVGATIADTFQASLTTTWTATGSGGATGFTASGSGNINDTVNMPVGSSVTYTVTANISSAATGTLDNTATITAPGGTTDPTPGNNGATDSDTLTPQGDLAITKTDGVTTATPGGSVTYTIVASNGGPSDVTGATVADTFPASLTVTYTAAGAGGASGFSPSGSGNINDTVNLPSGASVTYTATATISPAATGTLTNTATVTAPAVGATDPDPTNNSATDTDTLAPQADLQITKTDGVTSATPGGSVTYTITVSNPGPSDAIGAIVSDVFPAQFTSVTYTSAAAGGATGNTAAGSGNINDVVTLPSGGSITYTASGTISPTATGTLSNTATVTAPAGVTDPVPGNNSATDSDTLIVDADLSITKTDGQTTVIAGTPVTYTIVVSNGGPSGVVGAGVTDTFPGTLTGVNYTATSTGGATGFTASGTGNINDTVDLPVGSTITYVATGTVSDNATGTLSNTATVTSPAGATDPNPGNNTATDDDVITAEADLQITKTDGLLTAVPGQPVNYTIVVTNAGPSAATAATVTDAFPVELTGVTYTATATGGASGFTASGTGNINDTVNLPSGSTITYTVSATLAPTATGPLSNTATVTPPAGVTDPTPGNNSATDADATTPQADLQITKTDGVTIALPGQPVTYTIVVTNAGPSTATGATVSDTFPAFLGGVTYTSTVTGGATGNTASGSGNINDIVALPVGSSITYTATGTVSAGASGALTNTATVAPPAGTIDPAPGNNSATDIDGISLQADLSITKTDGQASVVPGQPVTYTIVVSNAGPSAANGATVSDTFPASLSGVTYTSAAAGGATGNTASGAGNINDVVNLPAGSSITYTATGTVNPAATGTLSNTATVSSPAGVTDANPGNNSATDSDTITPEADLQITKTDGQTNVVPGQPLTYTIVVSNAGPSLVTGATVADTFPATLLGVTYTSTAAGGATGSTASGTGNINDTVNLPSGSTITYLATGTVSAAATGTLSNTATVTSPVAVPDPTPGNNSATDTDTLAAEADLSVTKTDGPDPVNPGGTITYAITVANNGPSDALAVTLTDALPAGTTFVSLTQDTGPTFTCTTPAGGPVSCTIATLANGGSASFTLLVAVNPANTAGTTITNTATIASATTDDNPANDSATATTAVVTGPNVFGTKTVSSGSAFGTGTNVTYTVVLTNTGGSAQGDNPGDEFTDVLPVGVDLLTATSTSGTTTVDDPANTVHFNGSIPSGGTVTITITAKVVATSGPVSNQGTVFYDPNLDNVNDATRLTDDPSQSGGSNTTTFVVGVASIPTMNDFVLALLALSLALGGILVVRRS